MNFRKGFTLIELLVVIGVLAVIAAGVVTLINPVEQNRKAQDAKVQNDIGQIATAMQAFAATNLAGTYPAAGTWQTQLVNTGQLSSVPVPPQGGVYGTDYQYSPNAGLTVAVVFSRLSSQRYVSACTSGTPFWRWASTDGRACLVCAQPSAANPQTCTNF